MTALRHFAFTLGILSGCATQHGAVEVFQFFEPIRPPRAVQVVAHRGAAARAPENTRPSITHAIEAGVEWAELDVRRTRDGHHVLFHDRTLDAKTNGKGRLEDHTLAELKELDAGSWFAPRFAGEKLLTLAEALRLTKGKINLNLDLKAVNHRQLVEEIHAAKMERQVIVYDSVEDLKRLQKISAGKIAIMAKWEPKLGFDAWIAELKPHSVEVDADDITADVCRRFRAKGIIVEAKMLGEAWDHADYWEEMIVAGVQQLQTDFPTQVRDHILARRPTK